MDFQHRAGGKTGSGGVASASESNRDRRERLRQLALETIDLNKDPYFMKNHLGSYECKLCLTLHNNEGSYLAHTQGKKHQANLGRRAAKEAKDTPAQPALERARVEIKKFVKIGRPGYKVTKQKDSDSGQQSLLFQVDYPEVAEGINPRHRFMSAYEQRVEPPDKKWQYLLFAAEPYETISFKIPSREVDKSEGKFWTTWNTETKQFFLQFHFKMEIKPPGPPAPPVINKTGPPPPPQPSMPRPPPPPVPGMPRPPNIPGGFPPFPPNFGPPGPPMPPRMHLPPPMSLPMPPPPPPTFSTSLPPPSGPPRPPPGVPLPPPGGPPPPVSTSGLIPPPPIPPPPPPPSMPTPGAPPSFPLGAPPPPPPPPMPMPLMEADVGSSNETSS
ncbi:splicing factor 3A subunit 2-like [Apostichopus japonicus]|uniref:splicing factor 3A subunit 2-like n=1 Tax=Stichopus japonicus TaxID=307972 RepID=UPI003AB7D3E0